MNRLSRLEVAAVVLLFALSLALRLTGLNVFVANDEIRWTCRSIEFREALRERDWAGTFRVGHPGVVTTWLGAIFIPPDQSRAEAACRASNRGAELDKIEATQETGAHPLSMLGQLLFAGRVGVALFTWACIVLAFWLVRFLWGTKVAIFSLALVALDPFYLALSRVLHIDAVLTSLMTLSLLSVLASFRGSGARVRQLGLLLLSGAAGGLAMVAKSPAIFLVPFSALVIAIDALRAGKLREVWGHAARDFLLWCLAAGVVYVAFWPAMWVAPVSTVQEVLRTAVGYAEEGHDPGSYFLGSPVDEPGWGFYPVVLLFRLSPITSIGLLIGLIWLAGRGKRFVPRFDTFVLLLYSLLFGLLMSLGAKKLDRYLLPIFPSLAIVAAVGLLWATQNASNVPARVSHFPRQYASWFVILLLQLVLVLPHYPHYLTYYNPLVGGLRRAQGVLKVGWGEGYEQAAAYLNSKPDAEHLQVVAPNFAAFAPLFSGEGRPMGDYSASQTDYVLFYIAQVQRRHDDLLLEAYYDNPDAQPEHTVTLHGVDYVWIYPNTAYLEPLRYLEDRGQPEEDLLLINRDSALSKHYRGTLQVREFSSASSPQEVAALLDNLPSDCKRIWYPRYSGMDPATVLQLLQNRALLVEQRGFTSGELRLYKPIDGRTVSCTLDIRFGDLRLLGYRTTDPSPAWGRDGGVLLQWETNRSLEEDYTAFAHLYDSHDRRIAQEDRLILSRNLLPTSHWQPGSSGITLHHLSIPAGTPPGRYDLQVGVYLLETGERLPLINAAGQQSSTSAHLELEVGLSNPMPDAGDLVIGQRLERELAAGVKLLGSDLEHRGVPAGERVSFTLFWQAMDAPGRDYGVRLGLVDDAGNTLEQRDVPVVSTDYGTSQWRPGEIIREQYYLPTAESVATGEVMLTLNLLDHHGAPVLEQPVKVAEVWVQSRAPSFQVPPHIDSLRRFRLGDEVSLLGYELDPEQARPGDILEVTLYWRAEAEMERSHQVFVHLYDQDENIVGQRDRVPGLGIRPTTSWEQGEVIADRYDVEVSADLAPGTYPVAVGMYEVGSGERKPAFGPSGERLAQDRIMLGALSIGH
jgi:4-amino-4-deoxy-L-arabinose transferase-like glycosyltransferase